MKYPYIVNHNGVWYPAGTDVPADTANDSKTVDAVIATEAPEEPSGKSLTKTEIQRMRKEDLVALAKESGIDGADGMTGNELKEALIDLFGV